MIEHSKETLELLDNSNSEQLIELAVSLAKVGKFNSKKIDHVESIFNIAHLRFNVDRTNKLQLATYFRWKALRESSRCLYKMGVDDIMHAIDVVEAEARGVQKEAEQAFRNAEKALQLVVDDIGADLNYRIQYKEEDERYAEEEFLAKSA